MQTGRRYTATEVLVRLFFISMISTCVSGFDCLSDSGKPVDWFFVYKLPYNVPVGTGTGKKLLYMDPESPRWTLSARSIDQTGQALSNTLRQLYDGKVNKDDFIYFAYNDYNTNSPMGHANGVVGFDNSSGFWMVHSLPAYPRLAEDNLYTWTSIKYGQLFFCVSLASSEDNFKYLAKQLSFFRLKVYNVSMSEAFIRSVNGTRDIAYVANGYYTSNPAVSQWNFPSKAGTRFYSVAKSAGYGQDIYTAFLSPALKQDLLVQTWPLGSGQRLPSNCTMQYTVFNIDSLWFTKLNLGYQFRSTKDHSKWAVSLRESGDWICIGDQNRHVSQAQRGGGVFCLQNATVAGAFRSLVSGFGYCPYTQVNYSRKRPRPNSPRVR